MNQSSQSDILLRFIQGEDGKEWASERRQGWNTEIPFGNVCEWEGVTCNSAGQVSELNLSETDLLATIPTELALLVDLKVVDLGKNLFRGTIPKEVTNIISLESFILRDNLQISGSLPSFKSPRLRHLDLSRMMLTGTIPPDFGLRNTALTYLDLRNNQLSGFLPYGIEDLAHLKTFSISSNKLSGTLPEYIGVMTNLQFVYLDRNFLVGTIPPFSQPFQEIWLQNNLLSGTVPSIINLSKLRYLYIDGNKLTGTVPSTICNSSLNVDYFDNTANARDSCSSVTCPVGTVSDQGVFPCRNCTSSIPNPYLGQEGECDDWTETRIVNSLLGRDVPSACDLSEVTCNAEGKVTKIIASGLRLTGTIPDQLGLLQSLEELDISDNYLEGFFPSGLRFAPLTSLRIGGNELKGIVPPLVCRSLINVNGGSGDCTEIACPVGSFSKGDGFGECFPCGNGAQYLASTTCYPFVNAENAGRHHSILFLMPLATAIIIMLAIMGVKSHKKPDRKKISVDRKIDPKNGNTSFPHAEELKTILANLQKNSSDASSTMSKRLINKFNQWYHYIISLKETEEVYDPPGTKTTDVTKGEIDDFGWRERDSILLHRDLEDSGEKQSILSKLEVWEYPDPLEKPDEYSRSFDNEDEECVFDIDEDDLSEWIRKQQEDPTTREVWLDVPRID